MPLFYYKQINKTVTLHDGIPELTYRWEIFISSAYHFLNYSKVFVVAFSGG